MKIEGLPVIDEAATVDRMTACRGDCRGPSRRCNGHAVNATPDRGEEAVWKKQNEDEQDRAKEKTLDGLVHRPQQKMNRGRILQPVAEKLRVTFTSRCHTTSQIGRPRFRWQERGPLI